MKRTTSLIAVIAVTLSLYCDSEKNQPGGFGKSTVTALDGSKIEIPAYPQRIACFYNPAYDKIVMLSSGSRIALLPSKVSPWAYKFFPDLKNIAVNNSAGVSDTERLLKLNVDLVFYPKGRNNMARVSQAGIPMLCPFNDRFVPATIVEYTTELKRQIKFFSEVLGGETSQRAERYCAYLDDITLRVQSITSKIPDSDKPGVYYGRLNDLCSTQGNNTVMRWYTELAGGIYLPKKSDRYFATVNLEQVIAWNPDIVLLGTFGSFDEISGTPGLNRLGAYRNGRVYKVPTGIFSWDMTSCETALLPLMLGKKFHPGLFKDWDILKEMKKFYSDIYGLKVTDSDAERILNGMPPL